MHGIDVDRLYVYSERTGINFNSYIQKPQDQVEIKIHSHWANEKAFDVAEQ